MEVTEYVMVDVLFKLLVTQVTSVWLIVEVEFWTTVKVVVTVTWSVPTFEVELLVTGDLDGIR